MELFVLIGALGNDNKDPRMDVLKDKLYDAVKETLK
jgi:hypothetical protein